MGAPWGAGRIRLLPGSRQHRQLFPSDVSKINVCLFRPRDTAEPLPAPRLSGIGFHSARSVTGS